jgi:hypothetical protein
VRHFSGVRHSPVDDVIALLRYMRVEVLKVSGVADSLVWPTRLYGRLACMADSLVKHVTKYT